MSNVRVTRPYRKRSQYSPEFKAQLVAETVSVKLVVRYSKLLASSSPALQSSLLAS